MSRTGQRSSRRTQQAKQEGVPLSQPAPSTSPDVTIGGMDDAPNKRRRLAGSSSRASLAAADEVAPAQELSAFELARQEQIRRNKERLAALGIPELAAELAATIKQSKAPPVSKGVGVKRERKKAEAAPPRHSLRVRGMEPDGTMAAGINYETRDGKVVLMAGPTAAAGAPSTPKPPADRYHVGPVAFTSTNGDASSDAAVLDKLRDLCLPSGWRQQLQEEAAAAAAGDTPGGDQQPPMQQQQQATPGRSSKATGRAASSKAAGAAAAAAAPKRQVGSMLAGDQEVSALSQLQLAEPDVAKLTKEGVTCLAWHPTATGLYLAASDKSGKVSIWDVDYTAANSSSSNNGAGSSSSSDYDGVSMFAPHSDYVSAMKWVGGGSSGSATQLLSASYDGSVRLLDTQKGVFELLPKLPKAAPSEERAEWSAAELGGEGHLLLLATPTGWLYAADLRAPAPAVAWLDCHNRKVNTLHLDPLAPHLLASSCSDGSVKIWDVRSMATHCSSSSSTSSSKGSKSPKPLCTVSHAQSSQAAYWCPDGSQRLLSISFDDTLKIWAPTAAAGGGGGKKGSSGGDWQQQVSIRHNNQTGRWVVPFRPCWSPSGSAVLVGDMKRGVCVFDAAAGSGGGKAGQQRGFLTAPELMTAIPSRMAAHGGLGGGPVVAAATSSGRVHIWRR